MRLPNLSNGTVTLSKVEFYPRLSEETLAFSAVIEIDGLVGNVQSDGHGGPPIIYDRAVEQALLAAYGAGGQYPLLDVESVICGMVCRAADDHEERQVIKKMIKKGFRFSFMIGDRQYFTETEPSQNDIAKRFGESARGTPIVSLMQVNS